MFLAYVYFSFVYLTWSKSVLAEETIHHSVPCVSQAQSTESACNRTTIKMYREKQKERNAFKGISYKKSKCA